MRGLVKDERFIQFVFGRAAKYCHHTVSVSTTATHSCPGAYWVSHFRVASTERRWTRRWRMLCYGNRNLKNLSKIFMHMVCFFLQTVFLFSGHRWYHALANARYEGEVNPDLLIEISDLPFVKDKAHVRTRYVYLIAGLLFLLADE